MAASSQSEVRKTPHFLQRLQENGHRQFMEIIFLSVDLWRSAISAKTTACIVAYVAAMQIAVVTASIKMKYYPAQGRAMT